MAIDKDIVFMIGCPRSGTTLLNHLVRDELSLGFANELQLIPKYYRNIKRYKDLRQEKNLYRLIRDILQEPYFRIFKNNYTKRLGRDVAITFEDVVKNVLEPSLAGVVYAVLKTTADQLGTEYIGNKHLTMGLHLDWLYEMFPNARLIHVVRDGRDCALSLQRLWWGQRNAYTAAVLWASHIRKISQFRPLLGDDQFFELKYEDFLKEPDRQMQNLYSFVRQADPPPDALGRFQQINNIVKKGNAFKWKKKMPEKDIAIFEAVAGRELALHGYENYNTKYMPGFLEKSYYRLEDRFVREYNYRFNRKS